jgi:hypothetical protein
MSSTVARPHEGPSCFAPSRGKLHTDDPLSHFETLEPKTQCRRSWLRAKVSVGGIFKQRVPDNAPLKKYLMWITDRGNTISEFNTYLVESDQVTGPWQLVVYVRHSGAQGYFVNLPTKLISADGETAWLCYAANFTDSYLRTRFKPNSPGSGYGLCLHKIQLLIARK